jgi:cell division protease FtsH
MKQSYGVNGESMHFLSNYQHGFLVVFFLIISSTPTYGFIFNLFRDLSLLQEAVSDINQKNRKAVTDGIKHIYHSVKNKVSNTITIATASNSDIAPAKAETTYDPNRSSIPKVFTFKDLAGHIPTDVREVVDFLKSPEKFKQVGAQMPRGILLVGPPGTGKTSIAKAIAGEAKAHFFDASATGFIQTYVGVGPQRVRELFEKARESVKFGAYKKAIIFIDELDAIGCSRTADENSEYRNTLNELLNQMDGFKQDDALLVIGATNTPEIIDPALRRPGRFDRIVEIQLPGAKSREKILQHYGKQKVCEADIDFKKIATLTEGFSGADLKNLVNEAAVHAARANAKKVSASHFDSVVRHLIRRKKSSNIRPMV